MTRQPSSTDLKEQIRERYAERAREVSEQSRPATCGLRCVRR